MGAPSDSTGTRKGKRKEMVCTRFMWGHPCAKGTGVGISNVAEEEQTSSNSIMVKGINASLKIAQ